MEETSASEVETGQEGIGIQQIAAIAGLTDVPAFAAITYLQFGEPFSGAVAGLLTGLGIYLFLPWAASGDGDSGSSGSVDAGAGAASGGLHPGAAGAALMSAGVLFLAVQFTDFDPLLGLAGALVLAAVEYAVLSQVLPRDPAST